MRFRRTISQDELRRAQTEEQREQYATTYQASRGGHFPAPTRPVPGERKDRERR
ncbi:hypothetical protein [Streptomyces broussonetiae]|uniref:Uncharacterized protein n=1 Tax=Streptomyces broussonetiae TaxID=2686304 RepID=A0ABV5E5J0_9ACTN